MSKLRIFGICVSGLLTATAASNGFWIAAALGLASILAVLPLRRLVATGAEPSPEVELIQAKGKSNWSVKIASILAVACFFAIGIEGSKTPEGRERAAQRERERQAAATAEQAAAATAEAANREERRKGFQCLSDWDGSHRAMQDAVKEHLRNPGSFEHIETAITPLDDKGQHRVTMRYRAENGFGGMNVEQAAGIIDGETCSLLHLTM